MSEVTVADMESRIEELKDLVVKRDLAVKLQGNRDFKRLILEGFCVEDCARYAQLSADPSLDEAGQLDALNLAQAAGHLKRFLSVTVRMGNQAEKDIAEMGLAIDEMRHEEGSDSDEDQA